MSKATYLVGDPRWSRIDQVVEAAWRLVSAWKLGGASPYLADDIYALERALCNWYDLPTPEPPAVTQAVEEARRFLAQHEPEPPDAGEGEG